MKRVFISLMLMAVLLLPAPAQAGHPADEAAVSEWRVWSSGITTQDLTSISMVSATDGWAVGAGGLALHWDGSQWTAFPTGVTATLRSVDMLTSTDGWAVGDLGVFLHWNGSQWQRDTSGDGNNIYSMRAVSMFASGNVWAVGDWNSQPRMQHFNGYRWENWEMPQKSIPQAISIIEDEVGWIVGNGGYIMTKSLGDWMPVTSPVETRLNAVITNSMSDGWAAGDEGVVLHRLDNAWYKVETPTSVSLKSIAITPSDGLWIVGSGGTILHWNGSAWSSADTPITATLNGVSMVSNSDGWAVGNGGIILRYSGQNPAPAISSLAPSAIPAGTNGSVLVVSGSFFSTTSVVLWNGETLPTTYISDLKLAAQVPAEKLAAAGQNAVTVTSPAPGGGASASLICAVLDLPFSIFLPLIHQP